jgi:hypothetical protein
MIPLLGTEAFGNLEVRRALFYQGIVPQENPIFQLWAVHFRELSLEYNNPSVDPDMGHVVAPARVDEMGGRVEAGGQFQPVQGYGA